MRLVWVLLFWLLLVAPGRADEAIFPSRRVRGVLALARDGRLAFTAADGRTPLELDKVTAFRLDGIPATFRAAPALLLQLPAGQQLAGVFLGLERDRLLLRTPWAPRLEAPRASVRALTHLPGWRTLRYDTLSGKLEGWTVAGGVTAGADGLNLARPGQAVTLSLPTLLPAGRVSVQVCPTPGPSGVSGVLEAQFVQGRQTRQVRIRLDQEIEVEIPGVKGDVQRQRLAAGPQRLTLTFAAAALHVVRDEEVLWSSGGVGALRQVRLASGADNAKASAESGLTWSSFCLERAVPEARRPAGDPEQDELWLAGGDQLFGRVEAADPAGVVMKGRFGSRRYAWRDLRGWFLRQQPPGRSTGAGPIVRLEVRSTLRPAPDVLDGELIHLDARTVKLRHAQLGELTFPRAAVAIVRPLSGR